MLNIAKTYWTLANVWCSLGIWKRHYTDAGDGQQQGEMHLVEKVGNNKEWESRGPGLGISSNASSYHDGNCVEDILYLRSSPSRLIHITP